MIGASKVIYIFVLHFVISLEETDTLILLLYDCYQVDLGFIKCEYLCEYLFSQKY